MSKTREISWTVEQKDDQTLVLLSGEVNENAQFSELVGELAKLKGKVVFDLADIHRLNSTGVREWVNFMRLVGENKDIELTYERCSVPVMAQVNMIADFQGSALITSFFAPYANEDTGDEDIKLLQVADIPDPSTPPEFTDDDGGVWELDEIPERYFLFIKQQKK